MFKRNELRKNMQNIFKIIFLLSINNCRLAYNKNIILMLNIVNISSFLIGVSYSFLILNKIYFGFVLSLGILLLLSQRIKKIWKNQKQNLKKNSVLFLLICMFAIILVYNSILPERSSLVLLYLFLIIIFSNFYLLFSRKNNYEQNYFHFISEYFFNSIIVSIYNFSNFDFESFNEVKKFKGFLNIHTLMVLIIPFLYKSKLNLVSLLLLIPNLIMSNSNSPIMGIFVVVVSITLFYLFEKFTELKKYHMYQS